MSAKYTVPWACPKCGADANKHGKGGAEKCEEFDGRAFDGECQGLLCECDKDCGPEHGQTLDEPCVEANCYHCGWGGTMPQKPKGILPWEKKALEAGWTPPEGWNKKRPNGCTCDGHQHCGGKGGCYFGGSLVPACACKWTGDMP